MTTTTLTGTITERSAVETAATFDTTRDDYAHATRIALARRGTRDALIVHIARYGTWAQALDALPRLAFDGDAEENRLAIIAAAHWIAGDPSTGATIVAAHPGHRMMDLIGRLTDNGVPPQAWVDAMAGIDIDTCYQFAK